MNFFLCVIGMVMIVEGLPYFIFPEKMKQVILMVTQLPEKSMRLFGGLLILIGLVIVYIGKNLA
ncbi:MAG: hypothetical protein B6I26_00035 [Desulfobacteraceae bacterium 4572_130]|nr:MAG: hypothetical protein B6I26_00035 [Desulfobacteraceae bacterium 4572_130]